MTDYYVRSGAAGAGTGADWANAFTTLVAAYATHAAGDRYWVSEDHNESTAAAITLTSLGTAASPTLVYCVDHAGSVPPVSADLRATAQINTTGASSITIRSVTYYYGIKFIAGDAGNSASIIAPGAAAGVFRFDSCLFKLNNTNAGSTIRLGATTQGVTSSVRLINCVKQFGAVGQSINPGGGTIIWENTPSALAGSVPTSLFTGSAGASGGGTFQMIGVDLSAETGTIVGDIGAPFTMILQDCKTNASATVAATPASPGGPTTYIIRSDSGNTNYNQGKVYYLGTQTVETTIVRTGGATDGTTPISWKVVPSVNSKWILPFQCIPITIWNNTITASTFTVTLFGVSTAGSVPDNATVWMEIEGLGTASFPLGTITTTTKADNLASASAGTADGASTWGGGTTPFKVVSGSITMQSKGYLNISVKVVTSAGTPTIYIDPLVVLT